MAMLWAVPAGFSQRTLTRMRATRLGAAVPATGAMLHVRVTPRSGVSLVGPDEPQHCQRHQQLRQREPGLAAEAGAAHGIVTRPDAVTVTVRRPLPAATVRVPVWGALPKGVNSGLAVLLSVGLPDTRMRPLVSVCASAHTTPAHVPRRKR